MDLMDIIKEWMNPGSTAIYTQPGQSYGPAQDRYTHTPIAFTTNMGPGEAGAYDYMRNDPSKFYAPALGKAAVAMDMKPHITINPLSDAEPDPNSTIKHEVAHSIIQHAIPDEAMSDLAHTNPYFTRMAVALTKPDERGMIRGGSMPAEVPAYAAEPSNSQYGIPQNLQDLYRAHFIQQLNQYSPQAADQYSRLLGRTQ